jgi:hypothetical protein
VNNVVRVQFLGKLQGWRDGIKRREIFSKDIGKISKEEIVDQTSL